MEMRFESFGDHDIFKLNGEIKVNVIPEISPRLSKHISANPDKDLVLDLSAVDFIDSSTIRMLINLHKRLESQKRRLCLLSPSAQVKKIIEDVKLQSVFAIFSKSADIEQEASIALRKAYGEYTVAQDGLRKLICSCPVCGSHDVQGYLVDEDAYEWTWEKDDLFPKSMTKDTKTPFDVFSIMPIVCTNCYMSSLDFAHFHATSTSGEGRPAIAARLSEVAKQQLSKSIKTRKKIMESCVVIGDDFFIHPRKKIASFYCLKLAESCARAMATVKLPSAPFSIGYLNYLAVQYAGHNAKEELITTIRTWMNQVVAAKESYGVAETAKAYFILFASTFSLGKTKEAARILEEFSLFVSAAPPSVPAAAADATPPLPGFNSPVFWHSQARRIGEKLSPAKQ